MAVNFYNFMNNIAVEPIVFLYRAIYIILQMTLMNLDLQKNFHPNSVSKSNQNIKCDNEKEGILHFAGTNSWARFVMLLYCGIFILVTMNWDNTLGRRRKILILLPLFGSIFQALSGFIHSYYWQWLPLYAILTHFFFEMIFGNIALVMLISQKYLLDNTTSRNRTMRIGILETVKILGDLVGCGSAGYILHKIGFLYTYIMCLVLSVFCVILAFILLEEGSNQSFNEHRSPASEFFQLKKVFRSFEIVFNQNSTENRIIVGILCIVFTSTLFTMQGESSLQYMFLRLKFCWNERDYSLYLVCWKIGTVLGYLFCSVILSKTFEVHDALIGAFAGTWSTIAAIGYLLSTKNWHIYIACLFDVFRGTVLSVSVSFLSKFYEKDEHGHLYTVLAVFGLAIPICYPTYNMVFQSNVDNLSSAYYLLSISLDMGIVSLYCMTYILCKRIKIAPDLPLEREEAAILQSIKQIVD